MSLIRLGAAALLLWLARLSPAQWSDAFRAAGYSESDAQRYVQRLRQKVDDGLNVERGP